MKKLKVQHLGPFRTNSEKYQKLLDYLERQGFLEAAGPEGEIYVFTYSQAEMVDMWENTREVGHIVLVTITQLPGERLWEAHVAYTSASRGLGIISDIIHLLD